MATASTTERTRKILTKITANVFWVPQEARWTHLQSHAKQPTIGKLVDDAMVGIARDNLRLKGVLPKDYVRPAIDKHRPNIGDFKLSYDCSFITKRATTFAVIRETASSMRRHGTQVIDPTENTAPPLGVS